jgi:type IV secretion system protein VirB9
MSPMPGLRLLVLMILGLVPATGQAADYRIASLAYDDSAIVRLQGCLNFQTMITFAEGERIENVGLGDSNQWQVLPNKRSDLLFIKPLVPKAFSNMTVVTNRHAYAFELKAAPEGACVRGQVLYNLKFTYPDDPKPAAPAVAPSPETLLPLPEKRNSAYTYQGEKTLVPLRVFDDGTATYFRWAQGGAAPAIYALGAGDEESLVNFASRGDYIVVEQVARGFVLRQGKATATIYNDAFVVPALDALSPRPRPEKAEPSGKRPPLTPWSRK